MSGVPPKPASKRRRRNVPASYGAATPATAPAAERADRALGFDAHPLIADMWGALQTSCEARFYSTADWERVRLEMWFADKALRRRPISATAWQVVQRALNDLLVSPAAKRRAAIELRPPGPDADEDAAVLQIAKYRESLKPV
jgi:hypothetical protein